MRSTRILISACCLAFHVANSQVQAQPPGRPPGRPTGPPSPPWIAIFDTDSDGVISPDEIKNASAALLKLDRNHDGRLTSEEVMPAAGGPQMRRPQGPIGGPGDGRGPAQGGRRQRGPGQGGPGQGGPGQGGPGQGGPGQRGPGQRGPGQRGPGGGGLGAGGPGNPARADAAFAAQIMSLDTNGDGLIAVSELPEHMHTAFTTCDADGNGSLDQKELLMLASHFRRDKLKPVVEIETKPKPAPNATSGRLR